MEGFDLLDSQAESYASDNADFQADMESEVRRCSS
jgi:hypothetical protein